MEANNGNIKKNNKKNKKKAKKAAAAAAAASSAVTNEETEAIAVATTEQVDKVEAEIVTKNIENMTISNKEEVNDPTPAPQQAPSQSVSTSSNKPTNNNNNFDNLQKAVEILGRARQFDEGKKFEDALKLYRQGVDMLLEELIERQGTDQSRSYLRDKCNDFMNRIDQIKTIIKIENEAAALVGENKENNCI